MAIRAMSPDEVIIVREKGLQLLGVVAIHVEFVITSERLIVHPIQWIEQFLLGAKSLSLEHLDIEDISIKGVNQTLTIRVHGVDYYFLGEGAKKIKEHLQRTPAIRKNTNKSDLYSPTQILFQGNTDIYISGGLSSSGEIKITTMDVQINSLDSIENLLLSKKHFFALWTDITSFEYSRLNRVLKLQRDNDEIEFFGPAARLCHYILQMLKQGEQLFEIIEEVELVHNSLLNVPGFLFLGKTHTYFLPNGRLEKALGHSFIKHPINTLSKIQVEGWSKTTISLDFQNATLTFDIPYAKMWIQYYQKSIFLLYQENPFTLPDLPYEKEDIVFSCYAILKKYKNKQELYLGQLVMTREHLAFYPIHKQAIIVFPIGDIQQVEQKLSKLFVLCDDNIVEFQVPNPDDLANYKRRILNCLPPVEIRESRGNQSVEKILGETDNLVILNNGIPLIECFDRSVHRSGSRLQLFTGKPTKKQYFTKGETLEIDIAKPEGRFRFKTELVEDYFNKSDPMGRFYLGVAHPDNIFIYNKRRSFRVPFRQQIMLKKLAGLTNVPDDLLANLHNVSVSGCRLSTTFSLESTQINTDIIFSFSIEFEEGILPLKAKLLNIQESSVPNEMILGLQFIELERTVKERLMTYILQIEREILRQKSELL